MGISCMANVECTEVVIEQSSTWLRLVHQIEANESRPIPGDFGFASSDAECALVGEKRRRAACVQEDDILVSAPTPLADQGDQAREPLA